MFSIIFKKVLAVDLHVKTLKSYAMCLTNVISSSYFHTSEVCKDKDSNFSQESPVNGKEDEIEEVKTKILEESLGYVHQYGWTKETIAAGAKNVGYPGITHGLFPEGGAELCHYFYRSRNSLLENYLKESKEKKMKINALIRDAVEVRLRMIIPYKTTWAEAMAIMSSPTQAPTALKNLGNLVNTIWHYAGDKSIDTNWYTKRFILAAVYKSTEICLIQDQSPDQRDTWQFLDRRMENVAQFGKCIRNMEESRSKSLDLLEGGLITARNMIGLNWFARRQHVQ